ncbi:MAG TPA: MATE family efflux transporter [Hyphomicrobiaceae bacterium]|nr:MATE family efflux transporter [Hyphomicrobiaceae bacterium]
MSVHDKAIRASNRSQARVKRLLEGPIVPTLAVLAIPNVAIAAAQSLATMADAFFVGQLGVVPLAAIAVAFPIQALLSMLSQGAVGGGISSAVARALGAGDKARAEALIVHALVIAVVLGAIYTLIFAVFARPTFRFLGSQGEALDGAVAYAQILFGGTIAIWAGNAFASVLRGTGNMLFPAIVMVSMLVLSVPLSGALTLGWFGLPAFGVRGPAIAFLAAFAIGGIIMAAYLVSGRAGLRFRLFGTPLRWELFSDILRVGLVAGANAVLTILTIIVVTALVGRYGTEALAGYGLGSRLEIMLVPIAFGVGGALTAMVGLNRGAKAYARARRIAWTGGSVVFVIATAIGITVTIAPDLWLDLFTGNAEARDIARGYLGIAGPAYGFFGMGMALYFATQGTGRMGWPVLAGILRTFIVAGIGGILVVWFEAPLAWLFYAVAAGLMIFGCVIAGAVRFSRLWNPDRAA